MKKILLVCLALSVMFLVASASWAGDKAETVKGWVSDSQCGAKGANAGAADCTKKCVEKGAKLVVVTDGDQKVLMVENQDALKGHEGHHVEVTGHMEKDALHVDSVKML